LAFKKLILFSGLISLGNEAISYASIDVMEASTSAQITIPERDPTLLQNIAFKPIKSCIINGVTFSEDWLWMAIHYSLIDPAFLLGGEKFRLRDVIEQLQWYLFHFFFN
jgi:hypothetical protein